MRPVYFFVTISSVVALAVAGYVFSFAPQGGAEPASAAAADALPMVPQRALPLASTTSVVGPPIPVTLLFAGDIMLSRSVGARIAREHDPTFPFKKIADFTRAADISFANLESPVSSRGENRGSMYSFRADPSVFAGLVYAGFDVVNLANNHIWDWGPDALSDTVALAREHLIATVGAGRNEAEANDAYIIGVRGTLIGYIGYTPLYPPSLAAHGDSPGVSHFDEAIILQKIAALKHSAHIVVVTLHWGTEYERYANNEQKRLAHEFIDAGADLVIGHHPHVVEEVEHYKNGWIAYSLGNFVFDQDFSDETTHALVVRATIANNKVVGFEGIPISIDHNYQPYVDK